MHAERAALTEAGYNSQGGTLVTTLEPCVRKLNRAQIFPSCCELIVDAKIDTVIIGRRDASYTVHDGMGVGYLRSHGVIVARYDGLEAEIGERLMGTREISASNPSNSTK